MFSGPFLKPTISLLIGLGLGAADYYFFFLGAKFLMEKFSGKKIPLAFIAFEMIRLISLLAIILVLSFQRKTIAMGWLITGPIAFTFVKYVFLFRKLKKT
jgi:hypothetical protein